MVRALNSTLDPLLGAVDGMFNDLKADGSYNDVSMTDLLAGGAFLDATTIPVLNNNLISATERQDVMLNHVNAAALNWAWRFTRVWAMSYPMSLEECESQRCTCAAVAGLLTDPQTIPLNGTLETTTPVCGTTTQMSSEASSTSRTFRATPFSVSFC